MSKIRRKMPRPFEITIDKTAKGDNRGRSSNPQRDYSGCAECDGLLVYPHFRLQNENKSQNERKNRCVNRNSRHEPIGLLMEKMLSGVGSFQEIAHKLPSPWG